jgi:outer membrane protein
MKKTIFFIGLFLTLSLGNSYAQRYAFIDMEYIFERIPAIENLNNQLEALGQQWQSEIDQMVEEVSAMFRSYQADLPNLSGNEKTRRENEIVAKENAIQELRNRYFGPQGELMRRREAVMRPIQDQIFIAVRDISLEQGYTLVIDRASASSVIFASPTLDISDQVLARLGF